MRLLSLLALTFLLLSGLASDLANAGTPCSSTSSVAAEGRGSGCPAHSAFVCPAGDAGSISVTVTVRDCYGAPLANLSVTCNAIRTGVFCFCPGVDPQTGMTNVDGQAFFTYDRLGGCGSLQFTAVCLSVMLGPSSLIQVKSSDVDASCQVSLVDFSTFALWYGTTYGCCDYDCDGSVGLLDFSAFATHYGHTCP